MSFVKKTASFLHSESVFLSFPCLVALARTSSMMLNRSGESWHPYLVSDLSRKAYSL